MLFNKTDKKDNGASFEMRRLSVASLGFSRQAWLIDALHAAGWKVKGPFARCDAIGVWGRKPVSKRGFLLSMLRRKPVLTVEDSLIRSVNPGSSATDFDAPPAGIILDRKGVYFESQKPSELSEFLESEAVFSEGELLRAQKAIEFLKENQISKYNDADLGVVPDMPYILVIDQTVGDASVKGALARARDFQAMLSAAKKEHPNVPVLVKAHPEIISGEKEGYLGGLGGKAYLSPEISTWAALRGAKAVYTVSSTMGFEALMAGHRPVVFGVPFYAGWGLTDDRHKKAHRSRARSFEELFAAIIFRQSVWVDPHDPQIPMNFEERIEELKAEIRRYQENRKGFVAFGIRLWKRQQMDCFLYGRMGRPVYRNKANRAVRLAKKAGTDLAVWASKVTDQLEKNAEKNGVKLIRIEDGFVRSVGLGANLVPATSLVFDDLGIYYDPSRPSRLEQLIEASLELPPEKIQRAKRLRELIIEKAISKYNTGASHLPDIPSGKKVILVPGQVEDDASILRGADGIKTNHALLSEARTQNPEAFIIYKPHPDVEAGLRKGSIDPATLATLCDHVASHANIVPLLEVSDQLWTMTSLAGFEALLRGKKVVCFGMPFYAGWGLTEDKGASCPRRDARPSLDGLVHAALIDYPRYLHPISALPTTVERVVEELAALSGDASSVRQSRRLRILSKLQGIFAGHSWIWR